MVLNLSRPCIVVAKSWAEACQACAGRGRTSSAESYQIKIPAGVREGQRLRLPGRGNPGKGGGAAGDLFLRVHLAKHPDFRVEESNLLYELDVAPWEAVLGTNTSVPTLDGPVNIRIPLGTQNGQRLRLRGHGLPMTVGARGDLVIEIRLQLPEKISERERSLWNNWPRESRFKARE